MAALRPRISYANVVATLALFLALGGTSYAALTITGKQVKNSSLTGKDVKNGSIAGGDVKKGSLLSSHFKAGQLTGGSAGPAGPSGPVGATGSAGTPGSPGAPGTPGVSGLQIVETLSASDATDSKVVTATCPGTKKVVGGGALLLNAGASNVAIERSGTEDGAGAAWTAAGHEHTPTASGWRILAQAICANVAP
jgi:hypothetical protein